MAVYTGTDALEDLRLKKHDNAIDWGMERINEVLTADLALWSGVLDEYMGFIATPVTEQGRIWGVEYSIPWQRTTETNRGRSANDGTSSEVQFPLWKHESRKLGWTRDFLQVASVAEIAEVYAAAAIGAKEEMLAEIKKALFRCGDYSDTEPFKNNTLTIKRLLNGGMTGGDSDPIPSYGGVSFTAASHSHYLARAGTLANSDVNNLIKHVREHGGKNVKLFVNEADLAALAGISGTNFVTLSSGIYAPNSSTPTTLAKADPNRDDNDCMVGFWNDNGMAYEVWVKPSQMMPRYYMLAAATELGFDRPLGYRQPVQASLRGVQMTPPQGDYIFEDRGFQTWYGFGGNGRGMAAILYINGTSWTDAV